MVVAEAGVRAQDRLFGHRCHALEAGRKDPRKARRAQVIAIAPLSPTAFPKDETNPERSRGLGVRDNVDPWRVGERDGRR